MNSIPKLIQSLKTTHTPCHSLFSYYGSDWRDKVAYLSAPCPYPVSLYKTKHMELVLYGWKPQQSMYYYTGYETLHMHILEGQLSHKLKQHSRKEQGDVPFKYTIPPFSIWEVRSRQPTASLILYRYCYSN